MASEKIAALIEEVKALTVIELSDLVHALEEEFGVSAAAMAAPAAAGGAGDAGSAAEEQTEFDVVMTEFGAEKIKVIKEVLPAKIKEGINKDEATEIKEKLESSGAKVEVK